MKFIEPVAQFIDSLEDRAFYIYTGIAFGVVFVLALAILIWRSFALAAVNERLDNINEERQKVAKILTINAQLKHEEKHLNEILDKDPNFVLRSYFIDLLSKDFGIKPDKDVAIIPGTPTSHYDERVVRAELSHLDMEKLTKILQALDNNERITVKDLDIKGQGSTINVIITIATLVKKT